MPLLKRALKLFFSFTILLCFAFSLYALFGDKIQNRDEFKLILKDENGDKFALTVEDYTAALLTEQMPESFPAEALKAQAVILRTDTVNALINKKRHAGNFFCTGCEYCFPFSGRISDRAKEAAKATSGLILTYNSMPVLPAFHVSSNGFTENGNLPYLQSVPTPNESEFIGFFNTKEITEQEFNKAFPDREIKIFDDMKIFKKSNRSGRTTELFLGDKSFSGEEITKKLKLKSQSFTVKAADGRLIFSTYGCGNGYGMSQYGAYVYAKEGKSFQEILLHYYTGANISKISEHK